MRISDWSSDVCSSDLSARFKCEPSFPEAGAAVARDMDLLHAVQARFQIVGRTELDRRLDIPELRVARRKKAVNGFGLDEQAPTFRSEEHTSELQSLMRISYAVFCLKKKKH